MSKLSATNIDIGIESLPIGLIFPVLNVNTPPLGTLECDGSGILIATYPELYSGHPLSIGVWFGTAPAGQFYIPDIRGRGIRGTAHGSSRDPDRASRTADQAGGPVGDIPGSVQGDQYISHAHSMAATGYRAVGEIIGGPVARTMVEILGPGGGAPATGGAGGNETRMENIGGMWVIKY